MRLVPLAALCLFTTACSSIVEGTSQELTFNSEPSGADCILERNGETLGTVRTPGAIRVEKTKHDIEVKCAKEGYLETAARVESEAAAATFGNILLGGGIGWAIDSANGADNKYDEVTTVTLEPVAASSTDRPATRSQPETQSQPPARVRSAPTS